MRARLKKKAENRNRQLIHELLDLVLDINGVYPRKQEITGNLPTAFLNFNGHVGNLEVGLHLQGWYPGYKADIKVTSHTYSDIELRDAIDRIKDVKAETPGAATPRDFK